MLSLLRAQWTCNETNAGLAFASYGNQSDLPFEVYDKVVCEPTEASWRDAIAWARSHDFSHFLAYAYSCINEYLEPFF